MRFMPKTLANIVAGAAAALSIGCGNVDIGNNIIAKANAKNHAPVINSVSCPDAVTGALYACQIEAEDKDKKDTLVYSLPQTIRGLSIDPATGLVGGIARDFGQKTITVDVTDGKKTTEKEIPLNITYPGQETFSYVNGNDIFVIVCPADCPYIPNVSAIDDGSTEYLDNYLIGMLNGYDVVSNFLGGFKHDDKFLPIEARLSPSGGGGGHGLLADGRGVIQLNGQPVNHPLVTVITDLQDYHLHTISMHEAWHIPMIGLINVYNPRYSLTPYKAEESFVRTIANYLTECTTFCPGVASFTEPSLTAPNLIGVPGGAMDFRLANLLAAPQYGIDAGDMASFYAGLVAARDAKGSELNLWDFYNVANNLASTKAGVPVDTLPAFTTVGLDPISFSPIMSPTIFLPVQTQSLSVEFDKETGLYMCND